MNWNNFKFKFHKSWHSSIKKFIESENCNNIYMFLKNQKEKEIAPKSNLTFRAFETPLNNIKCVLFFEEPFNEKLYEKQYADGIALSCEFVEKIHSNLIGFYTAMEKEFYEMNLNIIKNLDLNFYKSQGVMFLNSSLTVEINNPGSHKGLWVDFNSYLIKNVFNKRKIPMIFCGEDVFKEYKHLLSKDDSVYFVIKQSLMKTPIGIPWNTENKFTELNNYLWNNTNSQEIMWVNQDVPF